MKISKKLVEKIRSGDQLTNGELDDAIMFYANLSSSLDSLGNEYALAARPVRETLYRLEDMKQARAA